MPASGDQNNQNNPIQPNLAQISSSDAPPISAGVQPVADARTPMPENDVPAYIPVANPSEPAPSVPPSELFSNPNPSMPATPPPTSSHPDPTSPLTPPTVTPKGPGIPKGLLLVGGVIVALIIIALLVVRFILPLFNNEQDPGTEPINQTEVVWWGLWEDQTIVAPIINEYQENNPGIKITYIPQSKENYRERLTSALARGEGPDIFRFHNTWVPMFKEELAVVPQTVMSQETFSQTFYPVMTRNLLTTDGIVGIPLEIDGLALFINEEIFTTFGKTPPTTWNEFVELAEDMTVRETNGLISQAGAAIGNAENVDHWQELLGLIMLQNGVNLNSSESLQSEQAAQALEFYTNFVTESQVWDDTQPNSTIAFASGKLAMYFGPSWRVFEIEQQNPNLQYRIVPVPQIPREDTSIPDITYASYWVEGVAENSRKKNEAWAFLSYLASKDTMQKFYESASQVRMFGEPYSRVDMRDTLLSSPKVGAFVELAPNAQSWYLASRTWDGTTGINSRISKYFEDAVNGIVGSRSGGNATNLMRAVAAGVQEVFVQYGLAAPAPVSSEE